ncbi:uncharacterized protein LOC130771711 [Actinidia eriantha]|uniref:uncharacterized protein LOC130771711 n=1 Tax=Actinidia eriantha TaxID=165200 RepID=UPI002587E5A6|nr:uncharacterized protein LOC130771711 [Actinidia eriantha]
MDNNEKELLHAFVVLQQFLNWINHACGMVILYLHAEEEHFREQIIRGPNPYQAQLDHLNRMVNNDVHFHEQLRVNMQTFMCLCNLVRSVGLADFKYVVLEEKVAMYHDQKNHRIKFEFMRTDQTVSKYFNEVLKAVLRLQNILLKTLGPITANCNDNRWRRFQNCLGALDGTYVRVHVPAVDVPRYRSKKGFYYLVDGGYTNEEVFWVPYRGQCYHLSTWRDGPQLENAEEFFNMKHPRLGM